MDGIIIINKPIGITSYDCIRHAKRVFKTGKIGHTGTLDPFASGLLVLCVGKATKLVTKLIEADKTYTGTIRFNEFYDTYDITGKLLEKRNDIIDESLLIETSKLFIKKYEQVPPIYSAIKVDGKKLYEYARENKEVEIKKRSVEVYDFKITNRVNEAEYNFETSVSKGTYIRSLIVDIAESMGNIAVLKTLTRTIVDKFKLDDAVDLENLTVDNLISIEELYKYSPKLIVNEYVSKLAKNGIYFDERQIETDEDFLVYNENNELIALYEVVGLNKYKPLIIF